MPDEPSLPHFVLNIPLEVNFWMREFIVNNINYCFAIPCSGSARVSSWGIDSTPGSPTAG